MYQFWTAEWRNKIKKEINAVTISLFYVAYWKQKRKQHNFYKIILYDKCNDSCVYSSSVHEEHRFLSWISIKIGIDINAATIVLFSVSL